MLAVEVLTNDFCNASGFGLSNVGANMNSNSLSSPLSALLPAVTRAKMSDEKKQTAMLVDTIKKIVIFITSDGKLRLENEFSSDVIQYLFMDVGHTI